MMRCYYEHHAKSSFTILRFIKNRIWTRETSLIIILTLFLIFGHFEPNYSYKKYSNKKKRCNLLVMRKIKIKGANQTFETKIVLFAIYLYTNLA